MKKRLTALILILTMLWSSGFEVVSGFFSAFAEEDQVERTEGTELTAGSSEGETTPPESTKPDVSPAEAAPAVPAENTEQALQLAEAAQAATTQQGSDQNGSGTPAVQAQDVSDQDGSSTSVDPIQETPNQDENISQPDAQESQSQGDDGQPVAQGEVSELQASREETNESVIIQDENVEPSAQQDEQNQESNNEPEAPREADAQGAGNQEENNEPAQQQEKASSDFLYPVTSEEGTGWESDNQEAGIQEEDHHEEGNQAADNNNEEETAEPLAQQEENASDFLYPVNQEEESTGKADNQEANNQDAAIQEENKQTEDSAAASPVAEGKASRTIQTQVGDRIITVTGNLPDGIEIQAAEIPQDTARKMTGRQADYAYDVRLMLNGEDWQPEDFGEEVKVTIEDLNGNVPEDKAEILHVKADLLDEEGKLSQEAIDAVMHETMSRMVETETLEAEAEDSRTMSFNTSSFSPIVTPVQKTDNILQLLFKNEFDNAVARRTGDELEKKIQIKLDKNTTYGSADDFTVFDAQNYSLGEDFVVEVIAEDAGDDGMQADGSTVYLGTLTILGLPVVIKGVAMPGNVLVNGTGSSLDYYGTRADDGLNLTVEMGAQAKVHTGEGADTVNAKVEDQGSSLIVDTGAGADTVTADVKTTTYGAGTANIETGKGEDTVNVNVTGAGSQANVSTGADADTVTAKADGNKTLTIRTGDDPDAVRAEILNGSNTVIDSGEGDDIVDVSMTGDSHAKIQTGRGDDTIGLVGINKAGGAIGTTANVFASVNAGEGNDTVIVAGNGEAKNPWGDISINLGSGENEARVDLSIADIAQKVAVAGGSDSDRLHVTGTLKQLSGENDSNASGNAADMTLIGALHTLNITTSGVDVITDNLANKREEKINLANQDIVSIQNIKKAFTNYVLTGYSDSITALNISKAIEGADADLIMTNVIIAPDADNKVTVADGHTITASGLQLALLGKTVQVDGTVKAGLVRIEAVDQTDSQMIRVHDQVPLIDVPVDATFSLNLLNISDVAKVTIGQTGRVFSEGDIIISSAVEQNGGIINIGNLSQINLVDLKVAKATVDVYGGLYAGYDLQTEQKTSNRGSVSITTSVKTTTGFKENGDPVDGLPLAIALANMDSVITIAQGAEIYATDNIRLVSNADLKLAARADSLKNLPIAVAAVYATVDSRVDVEGKLDAENDINVAARGNTEVTTVADPATKQKSISGGYVGLAVVLQNVKAELAPTAIVTAGRDVNVKSFAREKVDTLATTHAVDQDSGEQTAINQTGDLFKQAYKTLMDGWGKIKSSITGTNSTQEEKDAAAELDDAVRKVSMSDHGISVDEYAKVKGDVSIKTETVDTETVTGATKNTVTVVPKAGYKVKSITWRGLNPGDTAYTTGKVVFENPNTDPRTISFVQSKDNVTIFVEYEEIETTESEEDDEDEEYNDPEDEADLFEDGQTNNNIVVDDLLNKVTGAATDELDDEEEWNVPATDRTIPLSLPIIRENGSGPVLGTVLTYATEEPDENGLASSLKTVAPGQALRLVVNPAEGKVLKAGSLKIKYKHGDVTEIKLITADDHGRYIIYLPKDLDKNAGVQVLAEFIDSTSTKDVPEPQRGTQIAGAAAITITENNNEAVINSKTIEGTVKQAQVNAGRDVNVTAESVADIRNAADGTAVNQKVVTGSSPQTGEEETQTADEILRRIPVEESKIDGVTVSANITMTGPGDVVKITVSQNDKKHIKDGTLKAILTTKDGTYRQEIYATRKSDYTYIFSMPDQLPIDVAIEDLKVTFTGETAEGATGAAVTTSLGAAVALTVSSSHNRADIKGAVQAGTADETGNITVRADGESAVRTETRAGYSSGNMGIGGAVSAQIAAIDSRARIHKTAAVMLDGDLTLDAENNVQFYADADGSGSKRNAKSMGIGAGLAVAFDGAHAVAAIEDGAAITGKTEQGIGSLTIRANQTVDDQVRAAAGAGSTGTSLVAALSLDFVTTSAKAKLGDVKGGMLSVNGDVLITADNAAKHDLMSEGAVAGKGTGVGAALSGSLVKDKAIATLGESLNAGSMKVDAVNESAVRNVNIASASGGRTPFRLKVQDDIWLKLITGVVWLASIDNTLPKEYADLWIKYHLPNIMTSSTMGVAGAGGLNIQTSVAKAEVPDGVNVTANGKLAVTSQNRTEALVKGDASTTNSTMGIGVGAGVNFVKMDNIAFIGNGRINAASMEVTATTKEKELSFEDTGLGDAEGKEAEALLKETIGDDVDDYVHDLVREIGLDDLLPSNILDSIVSPVIDSATEEILGLAGLGEMFSDGIIQEAVDFFGDTWYISKWVLVGVLAAGIETDVLNLDKLAGLVNAQGVVDTFKEEFNTMLIVSVRDSVVNALKKSISNLFHGKAPSGGDFKAIITNGYDDILDFVKAQLKPALRALDRNLLKDLAALCGNNDLLDTEATDIIELARSKNKPKELSPYVQAAITFLHIDGEDGERYRDQALVLDEYAKKFVEYNNKKKKEDDSGNSDGTGAGELGTTGDESDTAGDESGTTGSGLLIKLDENSEEKYTLGDAIIKLAEEQNVMLTDDQKAVLRNPYDLMAEEQKASAGTHLIDTQGISGAGASGMSISGAAAVTKLDFTTKAQVGYDKVTEGEEPKQEDYTVSLVDDYIKKVTKPKGNVSDEDWNQYLEKLKIPLSSFVEQQKDKTKEYKEALANYKKELAAYKKAQKNKKDNENTGNPDDNGNAGNSENDGNTGNGDNTGNDGNNENTGDGENTGDNENKDEEKEPEKPKEQDYKLKNDRLNTLIIALGINPPSDVKFDDDYTYYDFLDEMIKYANKYIDKQEKLDKEYAKDKKKYENKVKLNAEHLGEQINVARDVLIDADSSRLVNNTASASLNGKGNASTNASAADAANSDVGDSSTNRKVTEGKNINITTDVGLQASIEDKDQDRPVIRIAVKDGFELEPDDKGKIWAECRYSAEETGDEGATGNEGGTEEARKIEVKKDSQGNYYIDTSTIEDVDEDKMLYFTLSSMEVLRPIDLHVIADSVNVKEGAVTAQVKGRDTDEYDEPVARAGDTVVVTVQKTDGQLPEYIGYKYTDQNGTEHTVEINPSATTRRDRESSHPFANAEDAFTSITKDGDEYILSFRMPDADENGVTIETSFIKYDEDPSWMPGTSFKLGISAGLLGPSISGLGRGMGVGASFTMLTGSDDTIAMIGDRQKGDNNTEDPEITGITAGKLTLIANADHREALSSVAGTDPLSGESTADTISATSLDASAAVNMLDTSVRTDIDKLNITRVKGYYDGHNQEGDVTLIAADNSETSLNASAFSAGRGTAVGASVVVNMATNDATVDTGEINATGKATIKAESHSRDSATAVASAVGADVIRILRVAGVDVDNEEDADEIAGKAESVAQGNTDSAGDDSDKPTQSIYNRLNENSEKNWEEDDSDEGEKTSDSMSLSSNVLRSQGVTTDIPDKDKSNMETTVDGVNLLAQIGLTGLSAYTHFKNLFLGSKTMISASVASTQATHTANVNLHGAVRAEGGISATADNTADFAALATAASMSLLPKAKAVSGGVAIVDNKNEANVKAEGSLVAKGDITLKSTLTQNLSEDYIGKLSAQSVSGSVAGYDSFAAIGAAISIVKSKGKATVSVNDEGNKMRNIEGRNIDIEAVDQSRLAARAGGVSISMGSTIGIGLGASKIKSSNTVAATIGDHTYISGKSFTLKAEKKEVTEKDYENLLDLRKNKGDVVSYKQKDEEGKENNVKVNLYADKIMDLYDGINKYSFQNNYVEAIGATAGLTPGKLSLGGAFAIIQTSNDVRATLGDDVYMSLSNANMTATDRATNRMIAGGLSITPSSASVGAAVTLMRNKDTAVAKIGSNGYLDAEGDVTLASEVGGTAQAFTAAMSMAISVKRVKKKDPKKPEKDLNNKTKISGGSISLAGAVNYIINTATATTETGSGTTLNGNGKTTLTSKADNDMMVLAADSNISIGWKAPAVGAAGNIIHDQTGAYTTIGAQNKITGKEVKIGSDADSQLITGVASQSAAATKSGNALAAAVNYNYAGATAKTIFNDKGEEATKVTATAKDASIYAKADAWALTAAVSLSGSVDTALGGSVNINIFDRTAKISMSNTDINVKQGDALIQSSGKDTSYMVGIMMEGSVTGSAYGGNVTYSTEDNDIRTELSNRTKVTAGRNVLIESYFEDKTAGAVGSISLANVGKAVGLTGIVVLKQNTVKTLLDDSVITAKNGSGATTENLSGDDVDGLYVGANAKERQFLGGAGIGLAGEAAVMGTAVSLKSNNRVSADASEATLKAVNQASNKRTFQSRTFVRIYDSNGILSGEYNLGSSPTRSMEEIIRNALKAGRRVDVKYPGESYQRIRSYEELNKPEAAIGGSATVEAKNDAQELLFAGGVNFGLGAGIGAAAVVLLASNEVNAKVKDIEAAEDVKINASNKEDVLLLNVNVGGSGCAAVEIGASVSDLFSIVEALAGGGTIRAWNGSVDLTAENTTDMTNVGVALAGAKTAAVSPVFLYTGFKGTTNAIFGGGKVYAGKDVTVKADSAKDDLGLYAVGAAFSGHTALSGAMTVVAAKDKTNALVAAGTQIKAGSLTIDASSDFKETAASATLVGSKKVALGVSGIVNIIKASTLAEMEGTADLRDNATVKASAARDVLNVGANATFSGGIAGGMTVMVLVAGDQMDQDAANQLTYGNTSDGKEKAFDSSALVQYLEESNMDTSALGSLTYDLEGNGQEIKTDNLGHEDENGNITFDGDSGYGGSETNDEDSNTPKETEDLKNARTVGSTVYTDSPQDAVKARIGSNAVITAGAVDVEAEQETLADLYGATVGIGGKIGGGISFTAAKLRSNVIAASLGDLNVTGGKVKVNAVSRSGEVDKDENEDESNRMKALVDGLEDKFDPSKRSIRAIGLAVGGGAEAGFAIAGGGVRLDNITQATLSGSVKNAGHVTVNSDASYSNIMAATVALAGAGEMAIAASIAAAVAEGTVEAKIDENTLITGKYTSVDVTTNSTVNVDTVAATAAASTGGAVVAGLSLAVNNLTQKTTVERGATIDIKSTSGNGELNVSAVSDTTAHARLMGVSVGLVGVGMGVAIAKIKPTVHTTVGVEGDKDKTTTLNNLWNASITNTLTSSTETDLLSAAAGGVAVAGNVLLVYNDTDGLAKASAVTGKIANNLLINGKLRAEGDSKATAASVGGVSVGATINHVDVNAVNTADLETKDFSLQVGNTLQVIAGEAQESNDPEETVWHTIARANTYAGQAGLISIGVNTGVVRNRAQNNAYITGDSLDVNSVEVRAYSAGKAEASVLGLNGGVVNVAVSVVNAMNEATSRAYVDLKGAMNGNLDVSSDVRGATDAKLLTGAGALLGGVYTNVATARGRTASIAKANIGAQPKWDDRTYTVKSTGRDDVNTVIENIEVFTKGAILTVGTMIGRAFSTDVYDAELSLTGGTRYKLRNISVTTDYETHVNAETTPSKAGVETSLVDVGVNKATAKNKSYAMAKLQTQGIAGKQAADDKPTTLEVNGNVIVKTTGSADANAIVKPAEFQVNLAVGVGVNKAKADVSGTQAAVLQLGLGGIEKAQLVDVQSIVNKTDAQATIGASGAKDADRNKIKISAVSVDSNSATANASLASTATVMGGVTGKKTIDGMVDYGYWEEREETYVDYDTAVEFDHFEHFDKLVIQDENGQTIIYNDVIFGDIYELWDGNKWELLDTAFSEKEWDEKRSYYFSEHHVTFAYKRTRNIYAIKGDDGNYYLLKTEKRKVWVEDQKPAEVEVNLYNPEKNILKAGTLNVYAGMAEGKASSATAASNGAKAFGIVTVGDLNASAHTGESISAMLEGVTATITGEATIKAASNTKAIATGYEPGGWSAVGGTTSDAKSGVGTQDEKETVAVVIGTGATLKAQKVNLTALNNGEAESSIEKGTQNSILAAISKGSLPTESWYDTLITVGENAHVESTDGDVNLYTADSSDSTSKVKSSGFSIGVNYNSMKGENEIHQENNIDIVDGATITANYGNVLIQAWQCTRATAETKYDGAGGVFAGSTMKADNIVKRVVRANIGENAKITADGSNYNNSHGNVVIMAVSGTGNANDDYLRGRYDNIYTKASVECDGFVGLSNAKAHVDIDSTSEIVMGSGAEIDAKRKVKLESLSTSTMGSAKYSKDLLEMEIPAFTLSGVFTKAEALSKGGIPLPNAVAKATLNYYTFININMGDKEEEGKAEIASILIPKFMRKQEQITPSVKTTKITSREDGIILKASNERLYVQNRAEASGKGAVGVTNANAWIDTILSNAVWIDNAALSAYKDLVITADNGGMTNTVTGNSVKTTYIQALRPRLDAWSKSQLKAVGKAKAHARITGSQINQIRSYNVNKVTLSSTTGQVIHLASEPMASVRSIVEANAKVPKIFGIKLGKTKTKEDLIWYYYDRCDFCGTGREYDVKPTEQMSLKKRYKEAYERALLPISDIQRMVDKVGAITRAHYGIFDDQTVASIYVLDIQKILKRDIRLDAEKIAGYKLWTNAETDHTTYLLPNATQLHIKGGKLDFVTEILRGDALGDGKTRYISLYTAVTSSAYARGIIPVGSTGTLNFLTGILTIPSQADYELYLHEVSSDWLIKQFESGMMRRASAPQESLNACALENGELPEMTYADALIPDGEKNGWLIFWLGNTPETAADADETLVYLLVNRATDEVDAYRTSVNMLAAGESPVDVSLYIYRDAKADRNEEELYDVFFFDTPEGEMSLVKVITNTIGVEMQIPRSLQIKLRRFRVKDSAETAFCLYDQVLILCMEENGKASALDGFYTATISNNTFESKYVMIMGTVDGNLVVFVKKGQPVWGEWTGENTAETIDGTCFILIDGIWYEASKV